MVIDDLSEDAAMSEEPLQQATGPRRYEKIAFVAKEGDEAQAALARLTELYGNCEAADADIVVALGGDGLMLHTLHQNMRTGTPIYGMHRGTVGFLMNEFNVHDLHDGWRRRRNR